MRIQVIESSTKRPLMNTKIQLQVKGKDSGFLTFTTDATGQFILEDKYLGQQILTTNGFGGGKGITAADGATLFVTQAKVGGKQKETTGGKHK